MGSNKLISINDRLPDEGSRVDAWVDNTYREADLFYTEGQWVKRIYDHTEYGEYTEDEIYDVTHWSEIPTFEDMINNGN
ncbi:MAG: hypothetical protein DRQ40_05040 [Gammaproteobacteria bacterium]|nr:MAG: hypothetical protein DRQ40_05040 [Gammaproteobacteria bacterium]